MLYNEIEQLWIECASELLSYKFSGPIIETLSKQTIDSIRRVEIYKTYLQRANNAEKNRHSYYSTNNPFTLAQRSSLSLETRIWCVYVATYFGKSNASKWTLFNRSVFRPDKSLISFEDIIENREQYFDYLRDLNLFEGSNYSNHRKYTKKSLDGSKGVLNSFDFLIDGIGQFRFVSPTSFDTTYRNALAIPNFGRMAAFDFTSSLCKCGLNVQEPESMYHKYSTGPLAALKEILKLAGIRNPPQSLQVDFGRDLLEWFSTHSSIYMIAQVLEDAICNWQKSPRSYGRYFG